jgi:hypothetical protein
MRLGAGGPDASTLRARPQEPTLAARPPAFLFRPVLAKEKAPPEGRFEVPAVGADLRRHAPRSTGCLRYVSVKMSDADFYRVAVFYFVPVAAPRQEEPSRGQASIDRGRGAERIWRETGVAETIPAVAADGGDVAMPLREAHEHYGTPRGAVPSYVNAFAVQSLAYTTASDALGAARAIRAPTLAPPLTRAFVAALQAPHEEMWIQSKGQCGPTPAPL